MSQSNPDLVKAIKDKLRHWIVDHTGVFPDAAMALPWAVALEEVAAEIRQNSEKIGKVLGE